jgi:hypothetical protein
VNRGGPDSLGALHRERTGDLEPLQVDHRDQVLVGDRDVGERALGVDSDPLGVGEMGPDGDLLDLVALIQVDHRDRAVGFVGDQAQLAVGGDRRAVGVAPGLHILDLARVQVHDRRGVGEVERGQ